MADTIDVAMDLDALSTPVLDLTVEQSPVKRDAVGDGRTLETEGEGITLAQRGCEEVTTTHYAGDPAAEGPSDIAMRDPRSPVEQVEQLSSSFTTHRSADAGPPTSFVSAISAAITGTLNADLPQSSLPISSSGLTLPSAAQPIRPLTPPRTSSYTNAIPSSTSSQDTLIVTTQNTALTPSRPTPTQTSTLQLTQTELAEGDDDVRGTFDSPDPLRIVPTPTSSVVSGGGKGGRSRSVSHEPNAVGDNNPLQSSPSSGVRQRSKTPLLVVSAEERSGENLHPSEMAAGGKGKGRRIPSSSSALGGRGAMAVVQEGPGGKGEDDDELMMAPSPAASTASGGALRPFSTGSTGGEVHYRRRETSPYVDVPPLSSAGLRRESSATFAGPSKKRGKKKRENEREQKEREEDDGLGMEVESDAATPVSSTSSTAGGNKKPKRESHKFEMVIDKKRSSSVGRHCRPSSRSPASTPRPASPNPSSPSEYTPAIDTSRLSPLPISVSASHPLSQSHPAQRDPSSPSSAASSPGIVVRATSPLSSLPPSTAGVASSPPPPPSSKQKTGKRPRAARKNSPAPLPLPVPGEAGEQDEDDDTSRRLRDLESPTFSDLDESEPEVEVLKSPKKKARAKSPSPPPPKEPETANGEKGKAAPKGKGKGKGRQPKPRPQASTPASSSPKQKKNKKTLLFSDHDDEEGSADENEMEIEALTAAPKDKGKKGKKKPTPPPLPSCPPPQPMEKNKKGRKAKLFEGSDNASATEDEEEAAPPKGKKKGGKKAGGKKAKTGGKNKGKAKEKDGADGDLPSDIRRESLGLRRRNTGKQVSMKEVSTSEEDDDDSEGSDEDTETQSESESESDVEDEYFEAAKSTPQKGKKRGRPPKSLNGSATKRQGKAKALAARTAKANGKKQAGGGKQGKAKAWEDESRAPSSSPTKNSSLRPSSSFITGHTDTAATETPEQRAKGWSLKALPLGKPIWAHVRKEGAKEGFWWPAQVHGNLWDKPFCVKLYLDPSSSVLTYTPEVVSFSDPTSEDVVNFRNPIILRFDRRTFRDSASLAAPSDEAFDPVLKRALGEDATGLQSDDEDVPLPPSSFQALSQSQKGKQRTVELDSESEDDPAEVEIESDTDDELLKDDDEGMCIDYPSYCLARSQNQWWPARVLSFIPPAPATAGSRKKKPQGKYLVAYTDDTEGQVARSNLLLPRDAKFFTVPMGQTELDKSKSYDRDLRKYLDNDMPPIYQRMISETYPAVQRYSDAFYSGGKARTALAKQASYGEYSNDIIDMMRKSVETFMVSGGEDGNRPIGSARFEALTDAERTTYTADVLLPVVPVLNYLEDQDVGGVVRGEWKTQGRADPTDEDVEVEAFRRTKAILEQGSVTKAVLAIRESKKIVKASKAQRKKGN
ncbi:hypothetical protein JCM11641_000272 [Rhodosporidiobolus odoratus]